MGGVIDELEREKSHADHMASMADYWMRRAQEAELMAGVLILAAGGEIKVNFRHLENARKLVVTREACAWDMSTRWTAA